MIEKKNVDFGLFEAVLGCTWLELCLPSFFFSFIYPVDFASFEEAAAFRLGTKSFHVFLYIHFVAFGGV